MWPYYDFLVTNMNVLELSEQEIGRRESLQQLRQMGIDPYPAAEYTVTAWSTDIINDFAHKFDPDERDREYLALRNRYTYRQYEQAYPGMDRCMKNATAMTEMYECSGNAIKKQDEKLNKLYRKIMKRIGDDKYLRGAIKEMELDWIRYKEAGAEFVSSTDTGSMTRLDAMDFVLESTMLQNELLELILDRVEDD